MSVETPDFADMVARMVRAYGRRVGDGDPIDLTRMVEIRRSFDEAIVAAVRGQREAGFSWAEIAGGLGTTKQSAWSTYGPPRQDDRDTGAA